MSLRKFIATNIPEYLDNQKMLNENVNNINTILDKINKHGQRNLTYDERTYLKQYNDNDIDPGLEKWLFSNDEDTFDINGNKLLYDTFEEDEDILYNQDKLKRVITKHLNKKPFTNNADWAGGYVWNIESDSDFTGTFLYLGDDELVLLKRTLDGDEYKDEEIKDITTTNELYKVIASIIKK